MVTTIKRPKSLVRRSDDAATRYDQTSIKAFDTELNWMAVAWQDDMLLGIAFGHPSRPHAESAVARTLRLPSQFGRINCDSDPSDAPAWIGELVDDLQRFAGGEPVDFSAVPLQLDHLTPFARKVVAACRRIRWGQVRTYGDLASACGAPGAARAVGSVMAKNRFPLVVPCHRVMAAGGALGGYSAPDGLRTKRRLLAMEGAFARQFGQANVHPNICPNSRR